MNGTLILNLLSKFSGDFVFNHQKNILHKKTNYFVLILFSSNFFVSFEKKNQRIWLNSTNVSRQLRENMPRACSQFLISVFFFSRLVVNQNTVLSFFILLRIQESFLALVREKLKFSREREREENTFEQGSRKK